MNMAGKEISRRTFGRFAAGALGAGLGLHIGANPKEFLSDAAETLAKTRIIDFRASGHSYRGIFFAHGQEGVGRGKISEDDFVANRLTILETPINYLDPEVVSWLLQRRAALGEIPENSAGVVFNDCSLKLQAAGSELLPLLSGIVLSYFAGEEAIERRGFLKKGLTAAAAGLMAVGAKSALVAVDYPELSRVNYYADLATPMMLVSTFRNLLVAAKTLDLEQDANLIFGKAHWAIPNHMQSGQGTLLKRLRRYPAELLDLFITDRRYLYTSVVLKKDAAGNYQRQEFIHTRLKEIFSPSR
jgi:hypothetical protein